MGLLSSVQTNERKKSWVVQTEALREKYYKKLNVTLQYKKMHEKQYQEAEELLNLKIQASEGPIEE